MYFCYQKKMKKIVLLFLLAFRFFTIAHAQIKLNPANTQKKEIQVTLNKNVELLGLVYFLGYQGKEIGTNDQTWELNGKKINGKEWYALGWKFYTEYKSFSGNKNLKAAMAVAEKIWLDYLINLLIQLNDFPKAKLTDEIAEKYYARFSDSNSILEAKINAAAFLKALNNFYKEIQFEKFLIKYKGYYKEVVRQVKTGLPDSKFIPAMEHFYKQQFPHYRLIPSLTIPTGMGFGVSYTNKNEEIICNVFGPQWAANLTNLQKPDLGFSDKRRILELCTHEFGHTFVNHIIDSLPRNLMAETQSLYDTVKTSMTDQGYAEWYSCVCEHFVRAGEIVIAKNLGNLQQAENLFKNYIEYRKFIYLPDILNVLEEYNKDPKGNYNDYVYRAVKLLKEKYLLVK
jgi:Domain of unknown function (DUF4932)